MKASIFMSMLFMIACSHVQDEGRAIGSALIYGQRTIHFYEADGALCQLRKDSATGTVTKMTEREHYPLLVETLEVISSHVYRSKRFNTTYNINDSAVLVEIDQKIVHPSSNWQGQTPWTEKQHYTFRRW